VVSVVDVGNNSMQCTSCQKWVHRKCNGINGSIYKLMKSFVCRGCVNPVTGTGCTSVDTGVNAKWQLVDMFCTSCLQCFAFSALMVLVGSREGHPACKN